MTSKVFGCENSQLRYLEALELADKGDSWHVLLMCDLFLEACDTSEILDARSWREKEEEDAENQNDPESTKLTARSKL